MVYGLFRYYMLQAQYHKALELAEQLRDLAARGDDVGFVAAADRAMGSTLVYMGRHAEAVPHLERMIATEPTPELRAACYRYDVVDPWVACRSYLAWARWLQGFPEQAAEHGRAALAAAEGLDHPFSGALSLSFASWLYQFGRDVARTREAAEKAFAIATEQRFAFWFGWDRVMRGWAMSEEGDCEKGIDEIREGLAESARKARAWAAPISWPFLLKRAPRPAAPRTGWRRWPRRRKSRTPLAKGTGSRKSPACAASSCWRRTRRTPPAPKRSSNARWNWRPGSRRCRWNSAPP